MRSKNLQCRVTPEMANCVECDKQRAVDEQRELDGGKWVGGPSTLSGGGVPRLEKEIGAASCPPPLPSSLHTLPPSPHSTPTWILGPNMAQAGADVQILVVKLRTGKTNDR